MHPNALNKTRRSPGVKPRRNLHNGLTAHGAGANMTPGTRRAMTCAYIPDGSTFNGTKNILPQSYVDQLQVGDPLNREDLNPRIWPGADS